MSDLIKRFEECKKAVDQGKQDLAVAKKEHEIHKNNYDNLLKQVKDDYGISSYEELCEKIGSLENEIEESLGILENKLKAGGLL